MTKNKGVSLTDNERDNGMTSKIVPVKRAIRLTPEEAAKREKGEVRERYTVTPGLKEVSKKDAQKRTGGKLAVRLTEKEAEEARKKDLDRARKENPNRACRIDADKLPVLRFPTKVRMKDDSFNGPVGMITFADGKSDTFHSAAHIYRAAAAGFEIYCRYTGIRINPVAENLEFTVDGRFWAYGQEIPEDILNAKFEKEEDDGAKKEVQVESSKANEEEVKPEPKDEEPHPEKIERLVTCIHALRPGHKEDWTAQNIPDANRLSFLLEAERGDKEWPFKTKVNKKERDLAWAKFNRLLADKPKVVQENAFAISKEDNAKALLEATAREKGKVYMKQLAEGFGVEDIPNDSQKIITKIIGAGVTLEQIKEAR